jgi:anaerobic magnesium-protoporphyrin IX monomethyl ester cyclase
VKRTRVLLVSPPTPGVFRQLGFKIPPLGIFYIAGLLDREGFPVTLLDMNVEEDDAALDLARFDVVGITCDTTRQANALALAALAKAAGALVVLGGPHPGYVEEELFQTGLVDLIVYGEGEHTMLAICEALEAGKDPRAVPNLAYRGRDGRTVRNARKGFDDALDALPLPARHLVDMERYKTFRWAEGRALTSICTSRGCPIDCNFCTATQFSGKVMRYRSVERVVDEVALLTGMGFGAVAVVDDNFVIHPRRVIAIMEETLRRRLDVWWWMFGSTHALWKNEDMVRAMAAGGVKTVYVGVESGDPRILRDVNKKQTPERVLECVRLLRKHGIQTLGSYILGNENDTRRSIRRTIDFAKALDTDTAQFSLLTPYPGTRVHEQLRARIFDRDYAHYDGLRNVFRHPRLSHRELQLWLIRANLEFYFRSFRAATGFFKFLARRKFGLDNLRVTLDWWRKTRARRAARREGKDQGAAAIARIEPAPARAAAAALAPREGPRPAEALRLFPASGISATR